MTTAASLRDLNYSSDRHSSRSLPLKLSSAPFCQGLPGSLRAVAMPAWEIHSRMAWLTNSGPLSERMNSGAPCMLTSRESTSTTRRERMEPATSIARHSRVYSSMTVRHLICWPSAVVSKTKSSALIYSFSGNAPLQGLPIEGDGGEFSQYPRPVRRQGRCQAQAQIKPLQEVHTLLDDHLRGGRSTEHALCSDQKYRAAGGPRAASGTAGFCAGARGAGEPDPWAEIGR